MCVEAVDKCCLLVRVATSLRECFCRVLVSLFPRMIRHLRLLFFCHHALSFFFRPLVAQKFAGPEAAEDVAFDSNLDGSKVCVLPRSYC